MPRIISTTLLFSCLTLSACGPDLENTQTTPATEGTQSEAVAAAKLLNAGGDEIGSVQLIKQSDTLSVEAVVEGLELGERAFHLHTAGICDGPDFKTAGGHLNPFEKTHGSQSEGGAHLGDLPNLVIEARSPFETSFELSGTADELLPLIFDEDGTAVILHAGPDDYVSDPAGAAGPRIACGVLAKN